VPKPRPSDSTPPRLCFFFNLSELGLKFLEPLHYPRKIIIVAQLTHVRGTPFDPLDQAGSFQFRNNPLHLPWAQAQPFAQSFLARVRLPLGIPPKVG
jgi:hypothetical protein